jgi:nickel-dependent lactate racemase
MNREYVEADRRVVLGFIEPHFMAGFSGGYKGIFPAVADVGSIMHYHRAAVIGHERSTWGVLEDNPTQDQIRENGSLLPLDFCINVTLNRHREITGFYCGDPIVAHERGCEASKASVMVACEHDYPIVVTTNGGYPLDQNLYQAVKGMSAASQIVSDGGLIISVARCNDGFPAHGNFRDMLLEHDSPEAMLETIYAPGFSKYDQWQVQLFAHILQGARVALHSEIGPRRRPRRPPRTRRGHSRPHLRRAREHRPDAPVAVLPEGPMTVPTWSTRPSGREDSVLPGAALDKPRQAQVYALVFVGDVEGAVVVGDGEALDARQARELADELALQLSRVDALRHGAAEVGGDGLPAAGVVLDEDALLVAAVHVAGDDV